MKFFISELFYALSLLALLHELKALFYPKKKWEMYAKLNQVGDDEEEIWEHLKKNKLTYILHMGYTLWVLIGLVTLQYIFFGALLILSLLMSKPRKIHWAFISIDAAVSAIILLGIILSHYHKITWFKFPV